MGNKFWHPIGCSEREGESFNFFRRRRVKYFTKKKFLLKKNSEKIREKREEMLQKRLEKAEDFRIDYMPLCMDEDMEAMSEFYREKNKKKENPD